MSAIESELLQILGPYLKLIERTAADVQTLKGQAKPPALLLSFRQAAKLLRVDRFTTLKVLVDSGQLMTVTVNGKQRIPRAEVDRLAAEGFDRDAPAKPRAKKRIAARPSGDLQSRIMKMKI